MSAADALIERALGLIEESFIASAGPGGQNVNKVATAVQLRLDVFALRLSPEVFHRLKVRTPGIKGATDRPVAPD